MTRILKPAVFLVAAVYFLVDAAVWTIAKPVARWLANHWAFERLRTWILSLHFALPDTRLVCCAVLVLGPAKPVAAYLMATGHFVSGFGVLGVAELLKLVLIERLFVISRDKPDVDNGLLRGATARFVRPGVLSNRWTPSTSNARDAWVIVFRHAVRRYLLEIKLSRKRERLSWQSR